MRKFYVWFYAFLLSSLISYIPVSAQAANCTNYNTLVNSLKDRFPLDLFYPTAAFPLVNSSGTCPIINVFGEDKEVCSIMQLVEIAKNAVLIKFIIQGVFSL